LLALAPHYAFPLINANSIDVIWRGAWRAAFYQVGMADGVDMATSGKTERDVVRGWRA